jgi:GNAT superfamily N-acetyltransferase
VVIRDAVQNDVSAMFEVRTSVDENHMTSEELSVRGITEESVREALARDLRGWVAEVEGRAVGFSLADRSRGAVWALFVLPAFLGRGLGTELLSRASNWLFSVGFETIFLNTDPRTRAYAFYRHRGWEDAGVVRSDDWRLELHQKADAPAPSPTRPALR